MPKRMAESRCSKKPTQCPTMTAWASSIPDANTRASRKNSSSERLLQRPTAQRRRCPRPVPRSRRRETIPSTGRSRGGSGPPATSPKLMFCLLLPALMPVPKTFSMDERIRLAFVSCPWSASGGPSHASSDACSASSTAASATTAAAAAYRSAISARSEASRCRASAFPRQFFVGGRLAFLDPFLDVGLRGCHLGAVLLDALFDAVQ